MLRLLYLLCDFISEFRAGLYCPHITWYIFDEVLRMSGSASGDDLHVLSEEGCDGLFEVVVCLPRRIHDLVLSPLAWGYPS